MVGSAETRQGDGGDSEDINAGVEGDSLQQPVTVRSGGPVASDLEWDLPRLREVATVVFAAAILGVGLWLLVLTFWRVDGRDDVAFEHRKDLLLVALGLMGTVTGYFFGRVPAEKGAKQAERQAAAAMQAAQQAAAQLQRSESDKSKMQVTIDAAASTVEMLHSRLDPVATERAAEIPDLARAQAMVEVLRDHLHQ